MTITDLENAQLKKLQKELTKEFKKHNEPVVKLSEKRRSSLLSILNIRRHVECGI